jgi:crossover junction endonuclease MUS81
MLQNCFIGQYAVSSKALLAGVSVISLYRFIILLVLTNRKRSAFQELKNLNVEFIEERRLNVGDFVWVARNEKDQELMLPYLVEKKRSNDLEAIIFDERYRDQNVSLHGYLLLDKCHVGTLYHVFPVSRFSEQFKLGPYGLPHVIFLVEDYSDDGQSDFSMASLYESLTESQIVDGFSVKTTNESVSYLAALTHFFEDIFKVRDGNPN